MKILHISDTHNLERTLNILIQTYKYGDSLVFLTGDNTTNYEEFKQFEKQGELTNSNTYYTIGNHDMWNTLSHTLPSESFHDIGIDFNVDKENKTLIIKIDLPFGMLPSNLSKVPDMDMNLLVNGFDRSWREDTKIYKMITFYTKLCDYYIDAIKQVITRSSEFVEKILILSHVPFITTWKSNDELASFYSTPELAEFIMEIGRTWYDKEFHIFSGHVHKNYDVQIGNIIQHVTYTSGFEPRIIEV